MKVLLVVFRLLLITMVAGLGARQAFAIAASPAPGWTAPAAKTIKKVGKIPDGQRTPGLFENMDCTQIEFRKVNSSHMQTGCFTPTALGLMDGSTVIFNGTDEAIDVLPQAGKHILTAWPQAAAWVVLNSVPTGGSYISLYKNPLSILQDQRDWFLHLIAKQITAPPDLQLKDQNGQRLIINAQTLTFSGGGSWLVAETLTGAFVRINLATLDIVSFAPAYTAAGHPKLFNSHISISSDGRYVAIANKDYKSFKVYGLEACSGEAIGDKPLECPYYDYYPYIDGQISGLQMIKRVRFLNNGLISFEAITNNSLNDGIYLLALADNISSLIDYLALGDSYTSGEGAFDYLLGTDSDTNTCHLSIHSYPLQISRALFGADSGKSVACSGATIKDVSSTSEDYRGQVKNGIAYKDQQDGTLDSLLAGFSPGYIAQHNFVRHYQPRIITVSVGGNDIGFGDIIEQCVTPHFTYREGGNDCFSTYEDRLEIKNLIDRTVSKWTSLFQQLKDEAPGSIIYALGYPDIASDSGECALNVHLSKNEITFSRELIDYLNQAIHKSAAQAGIDYNDVTQALKEHRLCENDMVAVNGVTAGKDVSVLGLKVFGRESYHPNALGHELIKQHILQATRNLTRSNSLLAGSSSLLKGPKTGRKINKRVPSASMAPKIIKRGDSVAINIKSTDSGLKPKSNYRLALGGVSGQWIHTGTTDSKGDISVSVNIPSGTRPGGQTINIIGENQLDESVDVVQPIFIPVSEADSDGDGEEDLADPCPLVVNSVKDADQDGVDDACDGQIGNTDSSNYLTTTVLNAFALSKMLLTTGTSKHNSALSIHNSLSTHDKRSLSLDLSIQVSTAPKAPCGAFGEFLRAFVDNFVVRRVVSYGRDLRSGFYSWMRLRHTTPCPCLITSNIMDR